MWRKRSLILSEVGKLAEACGGRLSGNASVAVTGVKIDSRKAGRGDLFICIKGEKTNGHLYAQSAYDQGCRAFLVTEDVQEHKDAAYIHVEDAYKAAVAMASAYLDQFSLIRIGVTGSVGKTTTRSLVAAVMSAKYRTVSTQGNYNANYGLVMTAFSVEADTQCVVFEMGMDRMHELLEASEWIKPDLALITNIGTAHMEILGSREAIAYAKLEIASFFTDKNVLVVNALSDYLRTEEEIRALAPCKENFRIVSVGTDYSYSNFVSRGTEGISFDINGTHFDVPLLGEHIALDCALACACGRQFGISEKEAAAVLANVKTEGRRLSAEVYGDIVLLDDTYNASPESMKAGLAALAAVDARRRIAVLGDMLELGASEEEGHVSVGRAAAQTGVDILIVTGQKKALYVKGAEEAGGNTKIITAENMDDLKAKLAQLLESGDAVLVKGSNATGLVKAAEYIRALAKDKMEKILVMGLGKSGLAAADLMAGKAMVSAWDLKEESAFDVGTIEKLKNEGVQLCLGKEATDALTELAGKGEKPFDRVIISPGITPKHPIASLGKELIGELELAYENTDSEFLAITGTNGKTTTTTLVGEILKGAEIPCRVVGNIGEPVSAQVGGADASTIMVAEVSSFQLETIKEFAPRVSAILNITPDHLDRHGSVEEYARMKMRVFENQGPQDFLVYNADDPGAVEAANVARQREDGPNLVPFTTRDEGMALVMEPNAAYVKEGYIYVRKNGKDKKLCRAEDLQIPGKHNLENALAAAAIAIFAGARAGAVSKVLRSFKGVEHRIEYVRTFKGVRYVNDSKGTNPDSTIKAIEATAAPIILIAGGYEKKSDFTELINKFDGKVKYLVLLGVTAERFKQTALKCGFADDHIVKCPSLEACVASAAALASPGDTVLLSPACASWDMFKSYEQRGEMFKEYVKAL